MILLQRSVAAGILILYVLLLRRMASGRLPKRTFAVLWKLAVVRLLLPFSVPVEINLVREWAEPILVLPETGMEMEMAEVQDTGVVELVLQNIDLIWFLGLIMAALFFLFGYVKAYLQFREAIPIENTSNDIYEKGFYERLTKGVKICVLDRLVTPITYGVFRPCIILPKTMEFADKAMLCYVLRHEMVHIKYRDNLWKLLAIIAFCPHWFNPLALMLLFFMNKDMEIACDESVISAMREKDRKKYALTLVMLAEKAQYFVHNGFGKSAVKERVREIMNYKKVTKAGSLCALLVMLGGTASFVSAKEAEKGIAEPMVGVEMEEGDIRDKTDSGKLKTSVTVFFEEGISEERIGQIGNELLEVKGVEGIGYTSPEDAWAVFSDKYLSEEVTISFKENPLKNSGNYTVYLSEQSEEAVHSIEKIDGVRRVNKQ